MKNQLKKLVYTKRFTDSNGETIAEWKLSPWKVFFILIAAMVGLIILYAYVFTENPKNFLGNVVFYTIIIITAVAVLWAISSTVLKGRKLISGFIIAFILILLFYWVLNILLSHFNILHFQMGGYALWLLITVLAGLGAKRIDGNLDRNDVGYGLLVFAIIVGANIPVSTHGGFLANIDYFIGWILNFLNVSSFSPF